MGRVAGQENPPVVVFFGNRIAAVPMQNIEHFIGKIGAGAFDQGGVGVAIDLATGRTTRAVVREQVTDVHPDTGAELVGYDLPDWEQTLEVGRRAAGCVPLGYLGVDIVLDADRGPLVLEMNARPGLEIQNVNGRFLGPKVDRVLA